MNLVGLRRALFYVGSSAERVAIYLHAFSCLVHFSFSESAAAVDGAFELAVFTE